MAEQAQVDELIQKMTEERVRVLAVLEGFSDEEAGTPLKPGHWTAKQQMSHLCEMETTYRAWVEKAVQADSPNLDGLIGERPAIPLERASSHSLAEHLTEMRRQRETTLALVKSLNPEQFDRRARNSLFGDLSVLQWLRSYYRHDRMHYDQLRGEEPSYKPRFVSGSEPDQRRGPRI